MTTEEIEKIVQRRRRWEAGDFKKKVTAVEVFDFWYDKFTRECGHSSTQAYMAAKVGDMQNCFQCAEAE